MPKGVYPRTDRQREQAKINFQKGREPEARKKAARTLLSKAQDPAWRAKVSQATKIAMHQPDIRERHLVALKKARKRYGINFKGGNGSPLTLMISILSDIFLPQGFIREYAIPTKKKENGFLNVPTVYKIDFAHPEKKIAIEVDGPSHKGKEQKIKDAIKTKTLQQLGWTVLRLLH